MSIFGCPAKLRDRSRYNFFPCMTLSGIALVRHFFKATTVIVALQLACLISFRLSRRPFRQAAFKAYHLCSRCQVPENFRSLNSLASSTLLPFIELSSTYWNLHPNASPPCAFQKNKSSCPILTSPDHECGGGQNCLVLQNEYGIRENICNFVYYLLIAI